MAKEGDYLFDLFADAVEGGDGRTALSYAAEERRLQTVLLLSGKADPNRKDRKGWSPLDYAVQTSSKG